MVETVFKLGLHTNNGTPLGRKGLSGYVDCGRRTAHNCAELRRTAQNCAELRRTADGANAHRSPHPELHRTADRSSGGVELLGTVIYSSNCFKLTFAVGTALTY
eukprot:3105269-Prymnesium_polylepis.1